MNASPAPAQTPRAWTLLPVESFRDHAAAWQALNAGHSDSPLLEPAFVGPLVKEFGTDALRLAIRGAPGDPDVMILLERESRWAWGTFQPSQAPIALFVAKPSLPPETWVPELLRALPGLPLVLGLSQLDPAHWARPAATPLLRTGDYIRTARVALTGTFEDYWKGRGRNLRKNMRRQRNVLEREGVTPRLEILTDPEDVAAALAEYGTLEASGWKGDLGTAVKADNAQGRFYGALLRDCLARGEGCIYRYRFNDSIVAMDLCVRHGPELVILKTTYDETISTSSPAMLMREETFAALFAEEGLERIEFYGKVMDWHTKWADDIRVLYHLTCARRPVVWLARDLITRLRSRGKATPEADAPKQTESA